MNLKTNISLTLIVILLAFNIFSESLIPTKLFTITVRNPKATPCKASVAGITKGTITKEAFIKSRIIELSCCPECSIVYYEITTLGSGGLLITSARYSEYILLSVADINQMSAGQMISIERIFFRAKDGTRQAVGPILLKIAE